MGIRDMAYIYLEPCGCCTCVAMASMPDLAKELAKWRRYRPAGSIDLVPVEEARQRINLHWPKEHSHAQVAAKVEVS